MMLFFDIMYGVKVISLLSFKTIKYGIFEEKPTLSDVENCGTNTPLAREIPGSGMLKLGI